MSNIRINSLCRFFLPGLAVCGSTCCFFDHRFLHHNNNNNKHDDDDDDNDNDNSITVVIAIFLHNCSMNMRLRAVSNNPHLSASSKSIFERLELGFGIIPFATRKPESLHRSSSGPAAKKKQVKGYKFCI